MEKNFRGEIIMRKHVKFLAAALAGVVVFSAGSQSMASSYTVVKGDSLWKIAKEKLGDGALYTEIYEANRDKIKNPSKIQIGQVLEIPDGVAPALVPEVSLEEFDFDYDNSELLDFEISVLLGLEDLVKDFNTLKVGETNEVNEEGVVSKRTRVSENLLLTENDIALEAAKNSKVRTFSYKTDYGYQMATYFTHKDGTTSFAVYDIPATGDWLNLIYIAKDYMGDTKERVELSDIAAGLAGYMEVTPEEDLKPGVKSKSLEVFDIDGTTLAKGYVYTSTEGNTSNTSSTVITGEGDITDVFYSKENGENTKHTLTVADPYGVGTLSFATDKDNNVIMDSISYVIKEEFEDFKEESYIDSVESFEGIAVGEKMRMKSAGREVILERISLDSIIETILYKDEVISRTNITKSANGELVRTAYDSNKD